MRRILLPQDTRTFVRMSESSSQLCRSGHHVAAGVSLMVSEPQLMSYDHRDQCVVWYQDGDQVRYLIVEETGVVDLMQSVHN